MKEAEVALADNEIPVGVVIVANEKVIARGHNLTQRLNDVTAHAEMQAITAAANHLGGKYLVDCTLYVTLEPCVMCAGALYWSQISRVVVGAPDLKRGYRAIAGDLLHPKTEALFGILMEECEAQLLSFFKQLRS
jgi:tRNA(adenine34) deaminase